MNKQTLVFVVVAFLAGFGAGYSTRQEKAAVERVGEMPQNRSESTQLPEGHPPIDGGGAMPGMPQAMTDMESKAIVGMQNVQAGEYERAVPLLAEAAKDMDAPALRVFQAIAAEGAGRTPQAKSFLKGDSDVELLRSIGREAFMEHQDFNIAGPAYQLYLKVRPNDPSRPMMENAVKIWKEQEH
ncbi:MAG: hypothetical protein AAB229_08895 [Candidatus Hydrogenedentota bacterium]